MLNIILTNSDMIKLLMPELIIVIGILFLLMVIPFLQKDKENFIALFISLGTIIASFGYMFSVTTANVTIFGGSLKIDPFGTASNIILLFASLLCILLAHNYIKRIRSGYPEYYVLILLSTLGIMILSYSNELFTFFISFELMSIAVYILSGINRKHNLANEAATKYFILGSFSTAIMLMGMALIYGATGAIHFEADTSGQFSYKTIIEYLINPNVDPSDYQMAMIGSALVVVGLLFKIGAVPFHTWVPDVYEGAPLSVTTYMATAIKIGGFVAFIRIFFTTFYPFFNVFIPVIAIVAVLTMFLGNIWAINQKSIKRMLAYSSIAHSGYLLLAVLAAVAFLKGNKFPLSSIEGIQALLFYFLAYTVMTVGSFGCLIAAGNNDVDLETFDDIKGFGYRNKFLGLCFTAFLFALAGFPTTIGFIGKLFVFKAALSQEFVIVAILGIIASIIAVYYYIKPIIYLYMKESSIKDDEPHYLEWNYAFALFIALISVFILGIWPHAAYSFLFPM